MAELKMAKLPDRTPVKLAIMINASDQSLDPITVRVATAVRITGLSRFRIYELIQAGDIEIVKVGRATLVRYASLQRLTSSQSLRQRYLGLVVAATFFASAGRAAPWAKRPRARAGGFRQRCFSGAPLAAGLPWKDICSRRPAAACPSI